MNLKEIRVSRKLKVQEVSDYLCCLPSVYSRYENGKREPSIDILLKLSKLYGVSVDCLIGNDMLSENKKRMVVAICAEEEISSIEWARLKKDKWVNRSISCPEYVQSIYKMMNWNKECRYKIYGRLANSERGLVLVFDLASAVMFDPLPEEYFDKHTGKMKKRIVKYYPDEIRMKLGRSYSDYEALQQRSSFESLSGYMDTSGGAVPATVSEELAASISMQEQEKKRETLFGTIIGNGGDDDVRNNE